MTFNINKSDATHLNTPDGMVHKREDSGHDGVELNHRGSSRWDQRGLEAASWVADQVSFSVHLVEDSADNVEGGDEVRAGVAEVNAHAIACLRLQGAFINQSTNLAVEHDIVRVLIHRTG